MTEKKQTLVEHLVELRGCLIRSLLALVIGMVVALIFSKEIFHWLQRPLLSVLPAGTSFITTNPIEATVTYLKVALLTAVFLSSPYLFYEIWKFVTPGLFPREKKMAFIFVIFSTLFFIGGALFGYTVIFPIGFKFFVSILAGTEIRLLPQMGNYLDFISKMLLTFGLIFELPVILTLLARVGLIRHRQLSRIRRYVIVLAFLAAGLLTPGPDILSQLLLALPLLALYEISLLAVRVIEKH